MVTWLVYILRSVDSESDKNPSVPLRSILHRTRNKMEKKNAFFGERELVKKASKTSKTQISTVRFIATECVLSNEMYVLSRSYAAFFFRFGGEKFFFRNKCNLHECRIEVEFRNSLCWTEKNHFKGGPPCINFLNENSKVNKANGKRFRRKRRATKNKTQLTKKESTDSTQKPHRHTKKPARHPETAMCSSQKKQQRTNEQMNDRVFYVCTRARGRQREILQRPQSEKIADEAPTTATPTTSTANWIYINRNIHIEREREIEIEKKTQTVAQKNISNVKVILFNFKIKKLHQLIYFQKRIIILIILYTSCALIHIASLSLQHTFHLFRLSVDRRWQRLQTRKKLFYIQATQNCSKMELAFCRLTQFFECWPFFPRRRCPFIMPLMCHCCCLNKWKIMNFRKTNCFY